MRKLRTKQELEATKRDDRPIWSTGDAANHTGLPRAVVRTMFGVTTPGQYRYVPRVVDDWKEAQQKEVA